MVSGLPGRRHRRPTGGADGHKKGWRATGYLPNFRDGKSGGRRRDSHLRNSLFGWLQLCFFRGFTPFAEAFGREIKFQRHLHC